MNPAATGDLIVVGTDYPGRTLATPPVTMPEIRRKLTAAGFGQIGIDRRHNQSMAVDDEPIGKRVFGKPYVVAELMISHKTTSKM
jgi:hypothetical protein